MAYNWMCEAKGKLNWESLNEYVSWFPGFEFIPMPSMGENGVDAIGISVPNDNFGTISKKAVDMLYMILTEEFGCTVYDLYHACIVTEESFFAVYERLKIKEEDQQS